MEWEPVRKVPIVNWTTPLVGSDALPSELEPSNRITVPVGVPPDEG